MCINENSTDGYYAIVNLFRQTMFFRLVSSDGYTNLMRNQRTLLCRKTIRE